MSLQIWLPLNGDLTNQGLNFMSFSPLNASADGISTSTSGKIGSCYQRTAKSIMRLRSSSTINLNNNFSMFCWLYVQSIDGTSANGIVTNHDHDTNTGAGLTLKAISTTDCRLSCNTGTGTSRTWNTYYGSSNLMSKWSHIGLTYNKSEKTLKLWVNGIVEYTLSNYSHASKADYIDIFGWSTGHITNDYLPNIKLNDVRIYDHCLSPREIKELSKGLFLHYQLKKKTPATNLIKNSTYNIYNNRGVPATLTKLSECYQGCDIYRLTMTPTADWVSEFKTVLHSHGVYGFYRTFKANTKYCFWIYYRPVTHNNIRVGGVASNIQGWTEIAPHYYQDGWYRVGQQRNGGVTTDKNDNIFTSFTCSSAATGVPISIDFCCPHLIEGYDSIIEEDGYQFDFNDLREPDVSGYNRAGTQTTAPKYTTNSPRYDGAYKIEQCQIATPVLSTSGLENSYTFSWWSKTSDMNGRMAWGFSDGNRLNVYPSTYFCWNTGDGTSNPFRNSSGTGISYTSYHDNKWHHYAVTGNGTVATLYIDGEAKGTAKTYRSVTGTQIILSSWAIDSANYRWNNGYLSDFRVYCTCLSAADVKELYNTPIEIDNDGNIYAMDFIEI